MANICCVHTTVKCDTPSALARLHDYLVKEIAEADRRKVGLYVGSERYLFDANVDIKDDALYLDGWVKWSIDNEEAKALLRHLQVVANIDYLKLEYDECGCCLYGFYLYENGRFTDTYLPERMFPQDDDCDDFYDQLDRLLMENSVTNQIAM